MLIGMTRSNRHKEKNVRVSEISQNNCTVETAARTRPFSFDEIMLRRKNKKQSGDIEVLGEAGNLLGKNLVEKISDLVESDRTGNKDSVPSDLKHASEELVKVNSKKKESVAAIEEDKPPKDKGKESRKSESNSKTTLKKYSSADKVKGGEVDEQVQGKRKSSKWSHDDCEKESERRLSRDLLAKEKEKHADRHRRTAEKERNDYERDTERRHSRNLLVKDNHADINRGNTEKESKRKHRNEDDDRSRDTNASKKHDSYRRRESEFVGKKEKKEASILRDDDSRTKRRRSRSKEHVKDSDRRSISRSPRAHKRMSYDMREHAELSAHSSKDRSALSNPDFDRMRMSNNGSSSHHRRHNSSSRLGGYSPRKRRTEAGAKTPSPTVRSPEKRSAGWDLPPAKAETSANGSIISNMQSSIQTIVSSAPEFPFMVPVSVSTGKAVLGVVSTAASPRVETSLDSIQLTQATRPSRRLYIENLPASASKESLMEFLNKIILSSGVHHMQGTHPCISCSIHKEKNQALVEFLTPEDASVALSFDGRSFSGSILKIRRPKDFLDAITGVPKKSVAEVGPISNVVNDSPHKIFVGGISHFISSDMLMEIACAFGPLKAYHFKVNADGDEPWAFLEYADQATTYKACAGLNGMKLGGQTLTVVQAIPDVAALENCGNLPSYEIPSHAKPLLEKPTQVLKLKNVMDVEHLRSISESELEEVLEDIRLECARFGTVKSVNVVKVRNLPITAQTDEIVGNVVSVMDEINLEVDDRQKEIGDLVDVDHNDSGRVISEHSVGQREEANTDVDGNSIHDEKQDNLESLSNKREPQDDNEIVEGSNTCEDKLMDDLVNNQACKAAPGDAVVDDQTCQDNSCAIRIETTNQLNSSIDELETCGDIVTDNIQNVFPEVESKTPLDEETILVENNASVEQETKLEENKSPSDLDHSLRGQSVPLKKERGSKVQGSELGDIFEPGCVLVEFKRIESACAAAHCLHRRLFDERIVSVEYVNIDLYHVRFPKQ